MLKQRLIDANVGFMDHLQLTRSRRTQALEFPFWATDTGLFGEKIRHDFGLDCYLRKLDECPRDHCLFATAPDVFGDGEATLRLSLDVLPRIRELGFLAAFVAQPGSPGYPWEEFDVLFVGGTDEFRWSQECRVLELEARYQGKGMHLGRVNSSKRFTWAKELGYDSVDGTGVALNPTRNTLKILSWVTAAEQLTLEDIA